MTLTTSSRRSQSEGAKNAASLPSYARFFGSRSTALPSENWVAPAAQCVVH